MWTWFKDIIFIALQYLHGVFGDWGLAIIAVTVIFRVILIPITAKQVKATYELQRIQPKMKALQEKYKDKPEKLQEEMAKFYSENKVNPLGGCLPSLLQMPIFIALFQVLRVKIPADATFLGIIPNLTITPGAVFGEGLVQAIPYLVLVALGGIATLIPQLMQKTGDKQTRTVGMYMSVMMLWFGWISPAGVLLYWISSSLFGAAQQVLLQKALASKHDDAEQVIDVIPVPAEKKKQNQGKSNKK